MPCSADVESTRPESHVDGVVEVGSQHDERVLAAHSSLPCAPRDGARQQLRAVSTDPGELIAAIPGESMIAVPLSGGAHHEIEDAVRQALRLMISASAQAHPARGPRGLIRRVA